MYDVLVVGAGQAGLAMGYYLKQKNLSFLLLDQSSEVGESWKKRYDSLTLFTPRTYSALPGLKLEGDQGSYPTKDEISAYLKDYATTFSLPIELDTYIEKLEAKADTFVLTNNKGKYRARNIVVATGPFQQPYIPELFKGLSDNVLQLHSSEYKNPCQLKEGTTLVVGGGNSGAQIATEISKERAVYLSVSHPLRFLPQDIGNKSIFWWFDKLGILNINVNTKVGRYLKKMPDPIFGFELKEAIKLGKVKVRQKAVSAKGTRVGFDNGDLLEVSNIIWSTGFKSDYSWIKIPSIFDHNGHLVHVRGITRKKGLSFLGMPWQYRRGSAILQGIGYDAKYLVENINT